MATTEKLNRGYDSDQGSDFLSSLVGTNQLRGDGSVKGVGDAFRDFTSTTRGAFAQ